MNGMTLGAKASPALTHSPRSGALRKARRRAPGHGLKGLGLGSRDWQRMSQVGRLGRGGGGQRREPCLEINKR